MSTPVSTIAFDPDPCVPNELTTLRQQHNELLTLLTAATHKGALNVIKNLQLWQREVLYALPPSSGITRDPNSLRGKTVIIDIPTLRSVHPFPSD